TMLGPGPPSPPGLDPKTPSSLPLPAYNDARGVTAAFNINLLARVNRELDGDFDLTRFAHDAVYNESQARIEMYLVSLARQTVRVLGRTFAFAQGQHTHTEDSLKYTVMEF